MMRQQTLLLLSLFFSCSSAFAPQNRATIGPAVPNTSAFRQQSTELNSAIGVIAGAMSGGLFAGGLHAIAGPDHLAALLPKCCGQRWYRAGRVGALWGMGHGVSATLMGACAFGLKNQVSGKFMKRFLGGASHVTEIAVGISLIIIGILGMKEAREFEGSANLKSLSAAAAEPAKDTQKRAVIFNGLLHGFSWDGAPSLAPALAVATWNSNLAFLVSYAIGTMTAMAVTTTLIGESTRRAGEIMNRPDIPQKLSFASSILAIAIGGIWCFLGFR